jgi:hypothetical protein
MLGLVKGVIVDGEVTVGEAQYLAHWINANPEAVLCWPGSALAQRLQRIFADGYVSDDEREDLRHFLEKMVGQTRVPAATSTWLPVSLSTNRLRPSPSRAANTYSLADSSGERERPARKQWHVLGRHAGAELRSGRASWSSVTLEAEIGFTRPTAARSRKLSNIAKLACRLS